MKEVTFSMKAGKPYLGRSSNAQQKLDAQEARELIQQVKDRVEMAKDNDQVEKVDMNPKKGSVEYASGNNFVRLEGRDGNPRSREPLNKVQSFFHANGPVEYNYAREDQREVFDERVSGFVKTVIRDNAQGTITLLINEDTTPV